MSRVIVSVGGSGQHIALAVTRLVMMGALKKDIQLIAIDPDVKTPLPKLLEEPAGLRGSNHPLQAKPVFPPFNIEKVGEKNFDSLFLDEFHPEEREFFEAMFDEECADIPIHKGMFGTPTVGATVFAEGANGAGLQDLLKPLGKASQVFVCGSVVGGTGAGVMHKLVGEIGKYYSGEIFGIFMLPWFRVEPSPAGGINDALIERNANHGIKYFYEHTIPRLTASALIGYPGAQSTKVLRPITLGPGNMGESPHYLHLVCAKALLALPKSGTAQKDAKAYAFMHDANNEDWILNDRWEHGSLPLGRLVLAYRWYSLLLRFVVNEKERLCSHYSAWLSGAPAWGQLHESILANAPEKKSEKPAYINQIVAEFVQMQKEAAFCYDWFFRILEPVLNNSLEFTKTLEEGAAGKKVALWPEISKRLGNKLPANAAEPNSPGKVARHHGEALLASLTQEAAGAHG